MSIDITSEKKKNESNSSSSSSYTSPSASVATAAASSLYENKTLMCRNNCGYYGNSIQYNGYCSICYRQLNQKLQQYNSTSSAVSSLMNSSTSFDDATSLVQSSHSFNIDDTKM
jgi:hypothetical protein